MKTSQPVLPYSTSFEMFTLTKNYKFIFFFITGNYVWIIGGMKCRNTALVAVFKAESSIWSIKRHVWIEGPELPKEFKTDTHSYCSACITAINSYTAFILAKSSKYFGYIFSYSILDNSWKKHKNPPNNDHIFSSCSFYSTKSYSR